MSSNAGSAVQAPQPVTQPKYRVLVAEDDVTMRKGLELNLAREGYEVLSAGAGEECVNLAIRHNPHLIVLDVMLPDMSGFDVCRELRKKGHAAAVIFLTVKSQEIDRVLGLELGADDYITKPFSLRELMARIRAHLRRLPATPATLTRYRFHDVELDFEHFLATRNGKQLDMTAKEMELLRFMVASRGEVLNRDRILETVWGYSSYPSTRTVDNFILRLRQKLEPDPTAPRFILSVYGEGYRFVG